jgi:AAA+ superfamily predicted ATPase
VTLFLFSLRQPWPTIYPPGYDESFHIKEIAWNKQAFEDLVAEPDTKELVQVIMTKQLNFRVSTDSIAGKGNGLIMLVHGAPGNGETFTAEGVAEFAEKPLLCVTCGDIGTQAEIVDQRPEDTF